MPRAIIIGATGQDGTYLYRDLAKKQYALFGIGSHTTITNNDEWKKYHSLDICDFHAVSELIRTIQPDEIYHLAAIHHSSQDIIADFTDFIQKSYSVNVISLNIFLEAIRQYSPQSRLFYAASSHIFGKPSVEPQDENTIINPLNVYGITKASGLYLCRMYRSMHDVFASAGILYNHESPLRGEQFVSRKIVKGARACKKDPRHRLILGDLATAVDWGFAPDYIDAMQRILHHSSPDDFIVASGERHTVGEFVRIAFDTLGLDWHNYVIERKDVLTRPAVAFIGNPEKLIRSTGWKRSVTFPEMVKILLNEAGDPDDR